MAPLCSVLGAQKIVLGTGDDVDDGVAEDEHVGRVLGHEFISGCKRSVGLWHPARPRSSGGRAGQGNELGLTALNGQRRS